MSETNEYREVIFNMLNFTNMYCIVLNENMIIKFVNLSLAMDLGFESYEELLDRCWLDFIDKKEQNMIQIAHHSIAYDKNNWEDKYKEIQNDLRSKDGKVFTVYWFNSHINTDYNWTFSFGIRRSQPATKENEMREFYYDIVRKDRVLINSMRDAMGLQDKIIDTCKPNLLENKISVG